MIFGTFEEDREFLTGKFRNPVFPEQPGCSNQELSKAAEIRETEIRDQKAETVKAELFEYVCDNMFIDVNKYKDKSSDDPVQFSEKAEQSGKLFPIIFHDRPVHTKADRREPDRIYLRNQTAGRKRTDGSWLSDRNKNALV